MLLRKIIYNARIYILGQFRIYRDSRKFKRQSFTSTYNPDFKIGKKVKIYKDFFESAGVASGHYFHQDLFVAREIFEANPSRHYDIGSRIDGFISHLAVFRKVEIFDIRLLKSTEKNIQFIQLDIMDARAVEKILPVESLSCLHTAEHFGLGRYGDTVDFDGWETGLLNMFKLIKAGGILYFSTPVSSVQRVEFNAHRVFNPVFLESFLTQHFSIVKSAIVRDAGHLEHYPNLSDKNFLNGFKDKYACGIWVLQKI